MNIGGLFGTFQEFLQTVQVFLNFKYLGGLSGTFQEFLQTVQVFLNFK